MAGKKRGRKSPAAQADFHAPVARRYDGPFLTDDERVRLLEIVNDAEARMLPAWRESADPEWWEHFSPDLCFALKWASTWVDWCRPLPDGLVAELERAYRNRSMHLHLKPATGLWRELLAFAEKSRKRQDSILALNIVREASAPSQPCPAPVTPSTKDGTPTAFDRATDALRDANGKPKYTPRQVRLWHEKGGS